MTLTDFLLARIAEDEAVARDAHYDGQVWAPEEEAVVSLDRELEPVMLLDRNSDAWFAADWSPARVLAECEAKRRIVELAADAEVCRDRADTSKGAAWALADAVQLLALPYADHPDCREEWKP